VNVVGSGSGASLTNAESNPPGGRARLVPLDEKRAPQLVGKVPEDVLAMVPSSWKTPALPTSVRANALVKIGTAIARVISVITIRACMYRFETSHFVLYEISPIVDKYFQ
jgi:hypothetical protein